MVAITMKRPKKIALTYDKSNPFATQTLDYFTSLGLFQVEKINTKGYLKKDLKVVC